MDGKLKENEEKFKDLVKGGGSMKNYHEFFFGLWNFF